VSKDNGRDRDDDVVTEPFPSTAKVMEEWLRVADGNPPEHMDEFFRFMSLWVAFNAYYTTQYTRGRNEWSQIKAFAEDQRTIDRHALAMKADARYHAAVRAIAERGVRSGSDDAHHAVGQERSVLSVVDCIYTIRSNLVHGDKVPTNDRDVRLVSAAHTIITILLGAHPRNDAD